MQPNRIDSLGAAMVGVPPIEPDGRMQPKACDHDCEQYAIHGALARMHHGKAVKECMKCGKWKPENGLRYDWQPANTLHKYLRGKEVPDETV